MKIKSMKIKIAMVERQLTQQALADAAGVTRATLSGALMKGSCSTTTAVKLAKALGVDPEVIMETEE